MTQTDKRFHVALFNDNTVRFLDYKEDNDFISISFKEHKDAVDCRDALMPQCDLMNELVEENKIHNERISLLSSLLDLADAIIDTSDNEKAKKVWENKNEQTEKEWERILNE